MARGACRDGGCFARQVPGMGIGQYRTCHDTCIGDGKIFVMDIERAMRIRTGEVDAEAL